jgi:hypothetical protein
MPRRLGATLALLLILLTTILPDVAVAAPAAAPIGHVGPWGDNFYGQLGNGTTINRGVPVQVSNLTNVQAIATGGVFSLALERNGTV